MKIVKSIKEMQEISIALKRKGKIIGFVPTMGYLHEGHLSLIRLAKKKSDIVVVSIFVNPMQFGPKEDFKRYPRDLKRDTKLARKAGCDVLFIPSQKQIYPDRFSAHVNVEKLSDTLEGKFRSGHFKGVTTVVAKLFNIVQPDLAFFGQKDAQQVVIIQKMEKMILSKPKTIIDYIAITDSKTLEPLEKLSGEVLISMAVFVGSTRLVCHLSFKL